MDEWLNSLRFLWNWLLVDRELAYHASFIQGDYCILKWKSECCPLTCSPSKGSNFGYPWKDNGGISKRKKDENGNPKKVNPRRSALETQTTYLPELKKQYPFLLNIYSTVLQQLVQRLDDAFNGFFNLGKGYPKFKNRSNFRSFQYAPGGVEVKGSKIYLPGLGWVRFHKSREIPPQCTVKTVTIRRKADGWYVSLRLEDKLVPAFPVKTDSEINTAVGLDMGLGKLIYVSDGSAIENPRFATSKKAKRTLKIRSRRVSRKKKGSKNKRKSAQRLARLHKKITDKREAFQWKAANKIAVKADAIFIEDLNIAGMKRRAKPKQDENDNYIKNRQSAKRGLNRSMSDASWGDLISKIEYTAAKSGKATFKINPRHTSQQCSVCNHIDRSNRNGEKFACVNCGHIDDANFQAARNIKRRGVEELRLAIKQIRKQKVRGDSPEPKQLNLFETPTSELTGGQRRKQSSRKGKRAVPGNLGLQLNLFNQDILGENSIESPNL